MSEFPSLAEVLKLHRPGMLRCYPMRCRCRAEYTDWEQHLADAWREACTVDTTAELDTLPLGSTLRYVYISQAGMSAYEIELSDDRRTIKIRYAVGLTVTLRSQRPDGFTNAQALRAGKQFERAHTLTSGQVNRSRLVRHRGWSVLLQLNTGPPTWRLPRIELRRDGVMVGWLRALVAASWRRER